MWGWSQARRLLGEGDVALAVLCPYAQEQTALPPGNLSLGRQAAGVTIAIELPLEEQIPGTCMQPPLLVNLSEYFVSNIT